MQKELITWGWKKLLPTAKNTGNLIMIQGLLQENAEIMADARTAQAIDYIVLKNKNKQLFKS